MATIVQRKQADGTVRYTVQIRLRLAGQPHNESRTFGTKAAAAAWAKKREDEIKLGEQPAPAITRVKVRKLIEDYLADNVTNLGRSKKQHLNFLLGRDLADLDALALTAAQLVDHIKQRRTEGTGPSTVNNDLIWLRIVWRRALLHRIPVKKEVIDEASKYCKQERLIAKPKQRVRRPTSDELSKIGHWFLARSSRRVNVPPMYHLMWAGIYSCRRLDELCRMRLCDWDRERGVWTIRDVKHPDGSSGHHMEMTVTDRLVPVIETLIRFVKRLPGEERLIPWQSKSVGTYWGKQLKLIGVEDLHWHDLRHEGCSRLAEDGWTIPQIQQVSLHESWYSLQRYVHVPNRTASRLEWDPTADPAPGASG